MSQDNIFANYAATAGISAAFGIGCGAVLYKSGISKPRTVRKQMSLESMRVVKTAVTALSASSLIAAVGHGMGWHGPILYPKMNVQPFDVVGGALLGTGLHLVGGTPETVVIQAATGKETALWAILGEVAGAIIYGFLHPVIYGKTLELDVLGTRTELSLDKDITSGVLDWNALKVAIPLTALLAGGLYVLEELFPEPSHVKTPAQEEAPAENFILRRRMDPYCAGLMLAALQIPSLVFTGIGLSSSDSYIALGGYLVNIFTKPNSYFRSIMFHPASILQILFHSSLALGGFLASKFLVAKDTGGKKKKGLTPQQKITAFVGGVVLIMGTRMTNVATANTTKLICTSFTSILFSLGAGIIASRFMPKEYLTDE